MNIGIPKEIKAGEQRVALTPKACKELIHAGHQVRLETGAGLKAGFDDQAYTKLGVTLSQSPAQLYETAELIVKVKEPQESEIPYFKPSHQLFCYLHLGGNPELTKALLRTQITAYAFETVMHKGKTPLLAPMSAIAGRLAVQLGCQFLHASCGGKGTLLGGTRLDPQGKVLVLGAGVAGLEAAYIAQSMGAQVFLFDINPDALSKAKKIMPKMETQIYTLQSLTSILGQIDLLIGAVYLPGKKATHVLCQEQIDLMQKGAVVVDISIDQGGCIETSRPCTHEQPYFLYKGVIHSAVTNLPAAVPHTATSALSAALLPYVLMLAEKQTDAGLESGRNLQAGRLLIEL